MAGLKRYIEWMSRGHRTNREAYVLKKWDLPNPMPGAEWQLDKTSDLADELLRDPELKTVIKAALEKGSEIVCPHGNNTKYFPLVTRLGAGEDSPHDS